MVRNCHNGPKIVVGVAKRECEFEATQCLHTISQTREDGIMIVAEEITLSWILTHPECWQPSLLQVPVWCEVAGDNMTSNIGYVHVNTTTAPEEQTTEETTPLACSSYSIQKNNSPKLHNISVYLVVMVCTITILVNR